MEYMVKSSYMFDSYAPCSMLMLLTRALLMLMHHAHAHAPYSYSNPTAIFALLI